MCGICGIVNFTTEPVPEAPIRKMMVTMKHRGPDDEGSFLEKNIGLGFVRLSIIDLSSAGHQPMFSSDERYVIVFNGEIFNYIEIRDELKTFGYQFKTNTDTEVLLSAYLHWGEECQHKFNGMWAFVIYDRIDKRIFVSRDRYGIKPFYYYLNNEFFAFSSEIPPLLSIFPCKSTLDNHSIFDYLVFNRTDQTERTFFTEIKKLQHGHQLKIEKASIKIKQWYNLKERLANTEGFQSPEEFREVFSSSVGLRLRSDVPVGVCLSGGLDSSSIVSSILTDHKKKDLQTFSVIFGEEIKTDERRFIKLYKDRVCKQYLTEINAHTFESEINDFVTALGEPVPSGGPFAQFNVMKIAKGNAIVLLDGQGADEILGGYKYFWGYYYNELLRKFKIIELLQEVRTGYDTGYKLSTSLFYMLPPKLRTSLRANKTDGIISSAFRKAYTRQSTLADDLYSADNLNQALINHIEYKLEHLLKWEDRNSMWFSLESRVPFLDYRIVEKTLQTDSYLLMHKGFTKNILREAMKNDVPSEILYRREKIGFGAPQYQWFREHFIIDKIESSLRAHKKQIEPYFDLIGILSQIKKHRSGKKDYSNNIWKVYNFILWTDRYLS